MKSIITHFMLPALTLCCVALGNSIADVPKNSAEAPTGTLETMIVASGTVAIDLDLNQLNGNGAGAKAETLRFQAEPNSFFPVLVFNNEFRGPKLGAIALVPASSAPLPAALKASFNQLVLEKIDSGGSFDLIVRDAKTGFAYFNIEGQSYDYDAASHSLTISGGRVLVSESFAKNLGRPAVAGSVVGNLSVSALMRPIEVRNVVNGVDQSAVLPPVSVLSGDAPEAISSGPDVIVGDLPSLQQFGSSGTQVGLAVGTTSCNAGNIELNWFALPNVDHPVIPQNVYRMSANADRFEQIGQSWLKHAFTALQQTTCGACTAAANGTHLGVGCSDPYDASLNSSQSGLGSRAWVNPFTGAYPSTARDHTGHTHNGTSHRILVEASDLSTTANPGASYFAEAQYVTPHEYAWCQSHPGECNMYNNASYRKFTVSGTTSFSFASSGATVRMTPAINAWTGATVSTIEPAPGVDGRALLAYKVTGPVGGVWHYEYALNNQNLDRSIQSFTVPLGCGVTASNIGYHAPLNPPASANDGTLNSAGYSNAAWTGNQTGTALTWSTETFAQNQNANALRWGTLYNFRFDSNRPPQAAMATVGFYKTGAPITVAIQAPTPDVCTPLALTTAVSRKAHGPAGSFDCSMPLTGTPGVESRNGGVGGNHQLVFTFANNVMSGNASLTSGMGSVAGVTFATNTMTVNLVGVLDAQTIAVKLSSVTDEFSQVLADTTLNASFLFGDANGDGAVNGGDALQTRNQGGQGTDATNFRSDVNVDGAVNSGDTTAVRGRSGNALP